MLKSLSNINKNVAIHTMGRSGSHILLDYLLINNPTLTIRNHDGRNIFEELHPYVVFSDTSQLSVENTSAIKERIGWKFNHELMQNDMKKINQSGKFWCIKSFGNQMFDDLLQKTNDVLEIFLYRESLSDQAVSILLSEKIQKYHWTKTDTSINFSEVTWTSNDVLNAVNSVLRLNYILLVMMNSRKKLNKAYKIVTYDQITKNVDDLFDVVESDKILRDVSKYDTETWNRCHHDVNRFILDSEIHSLTAFGNKEIHFRR